MTPSVATPDEAVVGGTPAATSGAITKVCENTLGCNPGFLFGGIFAGMAPWVTVPDTVIKIGAGV